MYYNNIKSGQFHCKCDQYKHHITEKASCEEPFQAWGYSSTSKFGEMLTSTMTGNLSWLHRHKWQASEEIRLKWVEVSWWRGLELIVCKLDSYLFSLSPIIMIASIDFFNPELGIKHTHT